MKKSMKLVLVISIGILLILSSLSLAQEKATKSGGGRGYCMMGWSTLDLDELNVRLKSKGYTEFSNNFFSIGGGGHGIINKLIIGGQGGTLIGGEETVNLNGGTLKTSVIGGYGLFDVGYLVYSKKGLNVYPMLGMGGGGLTFTIKEISTPSFEDLLENPKRKVELIYGGFLVNVSLGVDYLIKFAEDEKGTGGLIVGFKAGYMLAPFTHDWKMDENDVTGGPDIGFNGPYVKIMFGGGGMSQY